MKSVSAVVRSFYAALAILHIHAMKYKGLSSSAKLPGDLKVTILSTKVPCRLSEAIFIRLQAIKVPCPDQSQTPGQKKLFYLNQFIKNNNF